MNNFVSMSSLHLINLILNKNNPQYRFALPAQQEVALSMWLGSRIWNPEVLQRFLCFMFFPTKLAFESPLDHV